MKSSLVAVFSCLATAMLATSSLAGLPLHEDGVYQFNEAGKVVTYRVNMNQIVVQASATTAGDTIPGANLRVSGNLSSMVTQLKSAETTMKRTIYLQIARDGDNTVYTLRRKVMVNFTGVMNSTAVATQIGATSYYVMDGSPNYGVFVFAGAAESLAGAEAAMKIPGILSAVPILASSTTRIKHYVPNDSYYRYRPANAGYGWHINNIGVRGGLAGVDINGEVAWNSGKGTGIRMSVVDDGLEINHADLKANTLAFSGYDFVRNVGDPTAGEHGTCVGGLMAAVGDNNLGAIGVAWRGKILGLRILSDPNDPAELGAQVDEEEMALAFNYPSVYVCNNSWGYTLGYAPGPPLSTTLQLGIKAGGTKGRGGRGAMMVFSAGNGRGQGRNTNDSPMTNFYYALPVGATLDDGPIAPYSTPGAGIVASAPSGYLTNTPWQMITTTDRTGNLGYNKTPGGMVPVNPGFNFPNRSYTNTFNGTSASAPILSGALALMLEAKNVMSMRDVWDVIARTARPFPSPLAFQTRFMHGATYHTNHDAGHGMIDVGAATTMARSWKNLLSDFAKEFDESDPVLVVPGGGSGSKRFRIANAPRIRVEKVEVSLTIEHGTPNLLPVSLSSPHLPLNPTEPNRINSILAFRYPNFRRPNAWTYTTTQHWAECVGGEWILTISNPTGQTARVTEAKIIIHGGPGPKPVLAPTISATPMPDGFEYCQTYLGYQIEASGCPLGYSATGLPAGLYCDSITGKIYGTPYQDNGGVPFPIVVTAWNEIGSTSQALTLLVHSRISKPNLFGGGVVSVAVGEYFELPLALTAPVVLVPEGTVPTDPLAATFYSVGDDPLFLTGPGMDPDLVPLDFPLNGVFRGVPQIPGTYHYLVQASNYCGSNTQHVTINVLGANFSLANAMDVPGQDFGMEIGSSNTWQYGNEHFVNGGDSAVSPIFGGRHQSGFGTRVEGPVRIEFDWMTDCHVDDHLNFYIDGAFDSFISGQSGWLHYVKDLPAGTHEIIWEYDNASVLFAGEDRGHVDHLQLIYADLATAIGWTAGPVTSFGNLPWTVDAGAAKSGNVDELTESNMELKVTGPGTLTFDWRVSSLQDEDVLSFSLDERPVVGVDGISGTAVAGFTPVVVTIPAGTHIVRWTYRAGGDPLAPNTDGADAGWVDNVVFTPAP